MAKLDVAVSYHVKIDRNNNYLRIWTRPPAIYIILLLLLLTRSLDGGELIIKYNRGIYTTFEEIWLDALQKSTHLQTDRRLQGGGYSGYSGYSISWRFQLYTQPGNHAKALRNGIPTRKYIILYLPHTMSRRTIIIIIVIVEIVIYCLRHWPNSGP